MKKIFFSVAFSMLFCGLYGQNYLMNPGQDGAHITGTYSSPSFVSLYGISPGYTWNGRLSVNLNYVLQRVSFFGISESANALGPSISYLLNKQGASSFPIDVMAQGAYSYNWADGQSANTATLGLGLFHSIVASSTVTIVPGFGINYVNISQDGFSDDGTIYQASVAVKFGDFYIQPSLAFDADADQFTLGAGYIF